MKKIVIFGSTGSIGKQSLEVLTLAEDKFKVLGLTAFSNKKLLCEQSQKYAAKSYLGNLDEEIIQNFVTDADFVLNAVPGFDGLKVSIQALSAGKVLLSANKESLAVAGKYLKQIARENGGEIRPLDSEASAVWQLIGDYGIENTSSVTLTCSGGPFFGKKRKDLTNVTIEEALNHPTWKMGPKVSVDCATLVNKVLEVFEIKNLFDLDISKINVIIHRQSVVHSMIHTKSGATKMHISQNDMKLPIQYALDYPDNGTAPRKIMRSRKSELGFDQPDSGTFLPLEWLRLHGANPNFPVILNAANDVAVKKFLDGQISFLEIYDLIGAAIDKWIWHKPAADLDSLIKFHNAISAEYEHSYNSRRGRVRARGTR